MSCDTKIFGNFGPLVGAIDEGTSSCRFIIFKANSSESVASHQIPLSTFHPQEGWVEQDPIEILNAVYICIERAIETLISLGGKPEDIIGVGIANQRETTLVWDADTGKPLYRAIVWQDMRTSTTVEKLLDKLYGYISQGSLKGTPLMGCIGDQQSALVGQMCWQKGQAKATYGTGCFVLYNTGEVCVNSHSGLLTTVAFQLQGRQPYYALEGSGRELRENLIGTESQAGPRPKRRTELGRKRMRGRGYSQMCDRLRHRKRYGYSVAVAGTAIGWLKDNMGMIDDVRDTSNVLSTVDEEGAVVFVPAFSGLYAPYWRRDARGVICGITIDTTANHIVKAALEAVCHQVSDILHAMNKDCKIPLEFLKVDGGMTINLELMQMQADFTGIKVIRSALTESTALGAAIMAYWGVESHSRLTPLHSTIDTFTFSPKLSEEERENKRDFWKMAVERSLSWDE
ncbi:Glycerol kinase 2 [Eumeta japonica]|uniref:glycerol kinase n=1 Tax=Eumeta variegata TaxID=151549 RepID=A0A4C2A692_EUMVA|nr:Glycerol kinase 2 [Eumeta japonica]